MEDLIERALTAKIETAAITTVNAAITEPALRQTRLSEQILYLVA